MFWVAPESIHHQKSVQELEMHNCDNDASHSPSIMALKYSPFAERETFAVRIILS